MNLELLFIALISAVVTGKIDVRGFTLVSGTALAAGSSAQTTKRATS